MQVTLKTYKLNLETLNKFFFTFEQSLNIDFSNCSEIEVNTIKHGQIRKLRCTLELLWKTLQSYLHEKIGEDISGPKPVIKAALTYKLIPEEDYPLIFEAIETRNILAHTYDEEKFNEAYMKVFQYAVIIKKIINTLNSI